MGKTKKVGFERYLEAEPAYAEWVALQKRERHPEGRRDRGGRWYPMEGEAQECCRKIRPPSRAWPYSYLIHCRSIEHVARRHGIEPKLLRGIIAYTAYAKRPVAGLTDFCQTCGASWACEHRPPEAEATMKAIPEERADMSRHLAGLYDRAAVILARAAVMLAADERNRRIS